MNKQLMSACVVLVLLAGAAFFLLKDNYLPSDVMPANQALISDALSDIDSPNTKRIQSIQLTRGADVLLDAQKIEGEWQSTHLSENHPFVVNATRLTELVRSLTNATIVEYKSDKPSNHARLGLADISNNNPDTTLVTLHLAEDERIEVLLGKQSGLREGHFVRYPDSPQMLLIDEVISTPDNKFAWLNNTVLDINPMDISQVIRYASNSATTDKEDTSKTPGNVESTNSIMWKIVNTQALEYKTDLNESGEVAPGDISLTLADIQDNEKVSFDRVLINYIDALNDLSFEELVELDTMVFSTREPILSLEIMTKQGQVYQLKMLQENEQYLLNVSSSNAQITGHLHPWQLRIENYQAQALLKSREDFVTEVSEGSE